MHKTGNGIDIRQYVKAFVNDRINENLEPQYRGSTYERQQLPRCTPIWWTWRRGTNISYEAFKGYIGDALDSFSAVPPLHDAMRGPRLTLEALIIDVFDDMETELKLQGE
uniref:Uncharacterized protein n=1 Tax=Phytophthora fragariae TaxID=53985 RepID=A0A6A3F6K6_9STRA|nr:hypothetical protein PF009_g9877 [Phytophthora fragariae]